MVIGGGNLFRGAGLAKAGMNRVVGDHMGMLATVMNGLAMRDALHRAYVNARLMSAIPLNGVCDNYSWAEAISLLRNNRVVILSAGTGNPFFTTDSAACLRGIEIEADVVLKATKVDGVFTADPARSFRHHVRSAELRRSAGKRAESDGSCRLHAGSRPQTADPCLQHE